MTVQDYLKKFWWVAVVAVVCLVLLVAFIQNNGVTNNGNTKQQGLITLYNDTTDVLSDCLVKTKNAVGATKAQTDALTTFVTSSVKGQVPAKDLNKPVTVNPLYAVMKQAYPDTAGLSETFQRVLTIITGCRGDFRDSQAILQRGVDRFESWRTGSLTTRTFAGEYPTKDLRIKVAGKFVSGTDAIDQMRTLVVVEEAQTGRDTGKIENKDAFGETTTAP
jgi:hypothetical protein